MVCKSFKRRIESCISNFGIPKLEIQEEKDLNYPIEEKNVEFECEEEQKEKNKYEKCLLKKNEKVTTFYADQREKERRRAFEALTCIIEFIEKFDKSSDFLYEWIQKIPNLEERRLLRFLLIDKYNSLSKETIKKEIRKIRKLYEKSV